MTELSWVLAACFKEKWYIFGTSASQEQRLFQLIIGNISGNGGENQGYQPEYTWCE